MDRANDEYSQGRGGRGGRGMMRGRGMPRGGPRGGGGFRGGRGGGRGRGGQSVSRSGQTTTKLFVGNLPETLRKGDLDKLFADFGEVVECDILANYGFVHMANEDEASKAVLALNGHELEGNPMRVEHSSSKVRQQPGMGGENNCFKCGGVGHVSRECPTFLREHGGVEEYEDYGMPVARGRGRGMGAARPATVVDYAAYGKVAYADPRDDPLYQEYLRDRVAANRFSPYTKARPRAPAPRPDPYTVDPYAEDYPSAGDPYAADPYAAAADPYAAAPAARVTDPYTPASYRDPYERPPPAYYANKRGRGRGRGMAQHAEPAVPTYQTPAAATGQEEYY